MINYTFFKKVFMSTFLLSYFSTFDISCVFEDENGMTDIPNESDFFGIEFNLD